MILPFAWACGGSRHLAVGGGGRCSGSEGGPGSVSGGVFGAMKYPGGGGPGGGRGRGPGGGRTGGRGPSYGLAAAAAAGLALTLIMASRCGAPLENLSFFVELVPGSMWALSQTGYG